MFFAILTFFITHWPSTNSTPVGRYKTLNPNATKLPQHTKIDLDVKSSKIILNYTQELRFTITSIKLTQNTAIKGPE